MQKTVSRLKKEAHRDNKLLRPFLISALFVLLTFFTSHSYAQNTITVRGEVKNESGQPVPSASVVVKGQSKGVACDETGHFQINAPARGVLVISSVGFNPREVPVKGQTVLSIMLTSLASTVNDVVVIG